MKSEVAKLWVAQWYSSQVIDGGEAAVVVPQQSNVEILLCVVFLAVGLVGGTEKLEADEQERRAEAENVRKETEGKCKWQTPYVRK